MSAGPILIMAGGTGGHVFPALALARLLRAASHEVVWLGTRAGLEARVVPAENIDIEWLAMSGLRGKGALTLLAAPFKLVYSILQALRVLRRRRPALVVGFGGFVTGPGGVAAWLMRRPLLIHEQNAIAGYSNRVLARLARRVLAAFPNAFPAGIDARVVGNPVRADIVMQPPPATRFARREGALRLLIVGGSLGAARLNTVVPFASEASRPHSQCAPPGRRARHRGGAQGLCRSRRRRGCIAIHHRHGAGLRRGGPGDLPRRRIDHFRAGRGGRGRDTGAVPGRGRRSPDRQRAIPGARGSRGADRGSRSHAPAARVRAQDTLSTAANYWPWPSAPGCWRGRTPPSSSAQACYEQMEAA